MVRAISRKRCMKIVSRRLHKKAATKRQHQKVLGKASKACSRKMRLRRSASRRISKRRTSRRTSRRSPPRETQPSQVQSLPPQIQDMSLQQPMLSLPAPEDQNAYSYGWFVQQFEQAAARVAGVQGECTPSALTRALRTESRNLLNVVNNGDRAAYEADPRRQDMIRAYTTVLDRCDSDPFNNMAQARQAAGNV